MVAAGWSSRRSMRSRSASFTRFAPRSTRWRPGLPPSGSPDRVVDLSLRRAAQRALAEGLELRPDAAVLAFIQADVAFHTALYRLSGNRAIEDTVAAQWPHFKRSMGVVLEDPEQRPLVWHEHEEIMRLVLAGDAAGAETAARRHTDRAGAENARRLAQSANSREEDRDGAYGTAAPTIR